MLFVETNRLLTTKPYKFDIKCQCNSESYEHHLFLGTKIINRPSVAGTAISRPGGYEVYRLASSMPESTISSKPSKHHYTQTVRTRERIFWENVHPQQHVICHMSCVMCHESHIIFLLIYISDWATRWSVCYQQGLLHLVYLCREVLLTKGSAEL